MRLGIFADIHGNIYAFEKAWKALDKEACDRYIFLGDICGYYYCQNEVIEILKGMKNLISIRGNHDDMFLRMLQDEVVKKEYAARYGRSCELLAKNIKAESLNFLKGLPQSYFWEQQGVAIFHGSPWGHLNEYVYPSDSLDRFRNLPYRFVLLGHTHYPMDKKVGKVRVVNPGSCGQPRDYNQPSYAILDLESEKVVFKRIQYNTDLIAKDIVRYGEKNSYLIEVLKRTKEVHV